MTKQVVTKSALWLDYDMMAVKTKFWISYYCTVVQTFRTTFVSSDALPRTQCHEIHGLGKLQQTTFTTSTFDSGWSDTLFALMLCGAAKECH